MNIFLKLGHSFSTFFICKYSFEWLIQNIYVLNDSFANKLFVPLFHSLVRFR
jgi:hypothetical protein